MVSSSHQVSFFPGGWNAKASERAEEPKILSTNTKNAEKLKDIQLKSVLPLRISIAKAEILKIQRMFYILHFQIGKLTILL